MPLSDSQRRRYARHIVLPEVGPEGQEKLLAAKVLVVGAGGLGCPVALYLTAAGVGTIGLVDFDVIDFSNLQRQVLYDTAHAGLPKAETAAARLRAVNPDVNVRVHAVRLTSANAMEILRGYDIVVDGTDNFATRYLVNDACLLLGKINVYGSVFRFEGQASVFGTKDGPCYRCLFPEPPPPGEAPSCAEGGVLGILPGLIGLVQATETVKLILGKGTSLVGRLLTLDALSMRWRELKIRKDPDCPLCGKNPTVRALVDYDEFCGVRGGPAGGVREISPKALKRLLAEKAGEVLLLDVREPSEIALARIPGAVVIPLGDLPRRLGKIAAWKTKPVVALCHHGARSARAARAVGILRDNGFTDLRNLTGGIDAYSREADSSIPRY
ncbi:MAG: molybdopterin-synthase adenylyltransferase MoeB [Planctomycetota bacterium]